VDVAAKHLFVQVSGVSAGQRRAGKKMDTGVSGGVSLDGSW